MKVTHCVSSIDKSAGGTAGSVTLLINALLERNDISLELLTLESEAPIFREPVNANGRIIFNNNLVLSYSKDLKKALGFSQPDVFHGHGIWDLPVHQMAWAARGKNIPYVISPHGMLEPWSLTQSKAKKGLAMKLFQHADLKKAACIHATALMEVENIRNLGYTNPIANIPNGIVIADFPLKDYSKINEKKTILFLSRIHRKKGIELLFEAWAKLDASVKNGWQVEITGNGEQSYIDELNARILQNGQQHEIIITGPKFGAQKLEAYHKADLFVLPSYSENFGIVVAEALSCGVPVITTKGTPWLEIEQHNAGKWIEIGEEPLKNALSGLMGMDAQQLQAMGQNGRELVKRNYSIESVAEKMERLYHWVINGGAAPEFVTL